MTGEDLLQAGDLGLDRPLVRLVFGVMAVALLRGAVNLWRTRPPA
jgi:hypothetical protein